MKRLNWLRVTEIPDESESEFEKEVLQTNLSRLLLFSVIFFAIEFLILAVSRSLSVSTPEIVYFLLCHFIMFPLIWYVRRHQDKLKLWVEKITQFLYIGVMLAFGLALSFGSAGSTQLVYIYVMFVFACSSLICMNPRECAIVLVAAYAAFFACQIIWPAPERKEYLVLLNTAIFNVVAWVQARIVYGIKRSEFRHRKEIEEKNRWLEEWVLRDAMTGLYNHQAAFDKLLGEMQQTTDAGTPLSVIIADIDNFKAINDKYGHLTGDQVIRSVAGAIQSSVRKDDTVGRYGGEEFLIILPNTDIVTAIRRAEQIRKAVESLPFEAGIRVTLSGGVSTYSGGSLDDIIRETDMKLYRAKAEGKNRFVA